MKPSTQQFRQLSSTTSKIMMALALASVLGGTSITPALGKGNDARHDKGWHKGEQRSVIRNDYRGRRDPYYYSAPVYAPPPVYYAPQPSPGISLFFPLDFRR
jgi:hypothetical protein